MTWIRVALGVTLALAAGPSQAPGDITIVSAEGGGSQLLFQPTDSVNWNALLPATMNLATLSRNQELRQKLYADRSDYGFTEASFTSPLSALLQSRFYYLIDSAGVKPIRPSGLKVVARIYWQEDRDSVDHIQSYGYLQSAGTSNGGFVLVSSRPVKLAAAPAQLSADSLMAPNGGDYIGKGTPFREIVRQYRIVQEGPEQRSWIFVQWEPDSAMFEAGCSHRYTIFTLRPAPTAAGSTDLGCDV